MPRVPIVDGPSAEAAPLPGARYAASPAAGAGALQQAGRLNEVAQAAQGWAQQYQNNADLAASWSAETALKDDYLQFEQAELGKQGLDARGAGERAQQWWQQNIQKYGEGLDARAQFAFQRAATSWRQASTDGLMRHERTQISQAAAAAAEARIGSSINMALTDPTPDRLENTRRDITEAVSITGRMNGLPPEAIQQKLVDSLSLLHRGVVMGFIDSDPKQARAYYDQHKDEINAGTQMVLSKALEHGERLEKTQTAAADILAKFPTAGEAVSYIEKNYSGEELKDIRAEVLQRYTERRQAANEISAQAFDTARLALAQGKRVPADIFSKLDDGQKATIIEHQRAQAEKYASQAAVEAMRGFAAMPIANQRQALDDINAKIAQQGPTPSLLKQRKLAEDSLNQSETDYKKEPLRAGLERGAIPYIKPMDFSAGLQGVLQQLDERVFQADVVAKRVGKPVSPLLSEDADALRSMLNSMSPADKGNATAMLSSKVGTKQALALAAQMDEKDRPLALALAAGASMTTGATDWRGRQTIAPRPVSALILAGQQYLRDKGAKTTPDKIQEQASTELGQALSGKARADVVDAAALIYLGMQGEGHSPDMKRAVRLAVGGDIIDHAGAQIPIPAGVTADKFRDRLAAIRPADIVGADVKLPDKGQLAPGNIDLARRPIVHNEDGSISTVRSMSIAVNGNEYLIPTVSDNGRVMTDAEAIAQFKRTGKHLGVFDSPANATNYAKALHEQQANGLIASTTGDVMKVDDFVRTLPQAQLMPAGLGRYYVRMGAGVALRPDGSKVTIEVK